MWVKGHQQHPAVSLFICWFPSSFNTVAQKNIFSFKQMAGCFAANRITAWKFKDG